MKKIVVTTIILVCFYSAFSQQDSTVKKTMQDIEIENLKQELLINKKVKETLFKDFQDGIKSKDDYIDSLKKVTKAYLENIEKLNKSFQDSTKKINRINKELKAELSDLDNFKTNKKSIENQLKLLNDSIFKLNSIISEKDKQKFITDSVCKLKVKEEFQKGKQVSLDSILFSYKGKAFDTIILSSKILSVKRDKHLIGNNADVKQLFADLITYFEAKDLLTNKFDATKIKNAQLQLNLIKQQSALLDKLKGDLENYQSYNNGLKECLGKIGELDKKESVTGMGDEIKKRKFNKISSYIFNYDFNFVDYPYLSNIVLDIIKIKQPDADANISTFIEKL